jgi:hypothetical protein
MQRKLRQHVVLVRHTNLGLQASRWRAVPRGAGVGGRGSSLVSGLCDLVSVPAGSALPDRLAGGWRPMFKTCTMFVLFRGWGGGWGEGELARIRGAHRAVINCMILYWRKESRISHLSMNKGIGSLVFWTCFCQVAFFSPPVLKGSAM